jgi:ribosomal protein S18 acetylase RimI-like enzyme
MVETGRSIRAATGADRQQLANLIHFEEYIHRHLDWRSPLEWIGHHPYLVVEQAGELLAALACPPDPPGVAWIHLFAASERILPEEAWRVLWPVARDQLSQYSGIRVVAIAMQKWFESLLEKSTFDYVHDVVMLMWESSKPAPVPCNQSIVLRPMDFSDLDEVVTIDTTAFGPVWQNSRQTLEIAFMQSVISTVVEDHQRLIGYQISTVSSMGGHLARLAVRPEAQGQGVGYALVHDTLDRFKKRGARRVTVNTQNDNLPSLALYIKAGFKYTGESYRVYQCTTI